MNIENKKQIAIILLAVGLGLVAAVLVGNHIESSIKDETENLARQYEEQKIRPLMQHVDALTREVKTLSQRQMAVAQQQQQLATQRQPVSDVKPSSLSIRTPAGKRALTILIDSLSAVGGLINPGDYVDIMAHMTIPPPPNTSLASENVTAIIFQNMQVLAVGINIQTASDYASQQAASALNITLAVDPEEAGLLTFSQQHGRLQLILRAPTETETQILQPASWDSLGEYVLDKHGMELATPRARAMIQPVSGGFGVQPTEEVKPYIQIWRGGQQL